MKGVEPLSVKAARRWAALYTRGLPTHERERRCLELESDMWEQLHDADEPNAAPRSSDDFFVAYLPTCGGDIARFSTREEPGKGVST